MTQSLTKVKVYKNLTRNCLSLKCANTGLVLGHCESVSLTGVTFEVNEAGRDWVRRNGKKIVHAYVVGDLQECSGYKPFKQRSITSGENFPRSYIMSPAFYNPHKVDQFVKAMTNEPVTRADYAKVIHNGGTWYGYNDNRGSEDVY